MNSILVAHFNAKDALMYQFYIHLHDCFSFHQNMQVYNNLEERNKTICKIKNEMAESEVGWPM
jgi:hypothetical protein